MKAPKILPRTGLLVCSWLALLACQQPSASSKSQQTAQASSSQAGPTSQAYGEFTPLPDALMPKKDSHLSDKVITSPILTKGQGQFDFHQQKQLGHLPYANPKARQGGELSLAAMGMFNSLNAFIDQGFAAAGTFYLYDTLMAGSLDESFVLYPQLAWAVSFDPDDKSWIVYHIDKRARFWDGSFVKAQDVKATFDAILRDGLMSWRGFLSGIEHIEVLDDHRVKFYFSDLASEDLGSSVGLMPIFAKKDLDRRFLQVGFEPLLGSGPYQLKDFSPSSYVTYQKDPNYWGKDLLVNQGRFNFENITFRYYQDDAIAFEAFKLGQHRFHFENNNKRWATFSPQTSRIIKANIPNQNPVLMQGLVMNLRRPLFQDKKVRQALNLAFDFEWINQRLLYGQYDRLTSYFYGSPLAAQAKPSQEELVILKSLPLNQDEQAALIGVPDQPKSLGDGYNRQNLLKAKGLLLQAGMHYQQGKLLDRQNQAVSFDILIQDDKHLSLLLPYVHNLNRLGITANLVRLDAASYLNRKRAFDFDMLIDSFMQGNSPGAEQAYLWGSEAAKQPGNQNTIGIQSQAVDQVISQLITSDTQSKTILYTKVLDRLLLAGEYMIPWYGKSGTQVMYWQGYAHPSRLPNSSLGLDYWWYEPANLADQH